MKRVMCLMLLLLISGCNIPNHQAQESNLKSKPTHSNPIEEWVQSSLERGVFYKIDFKLNKVWMSLWVWNLEDNEAKQKCIILLSQYFDSKNGIKLVTIHDRFSNKKLGEYAEFGRIKICE